MWPRATLSSLQIGIDIRYSRIALGCTPMLLLMMNSVLPDPRLYSADAKSNELRIADVHHDLDRNVGQFAAQDFGHFSFEQAVVDPSSPSAHDKVPTGFAARRLHRRNTTAGTPSSRKWPGGGPPAAIRRCRCASSPAPVRVVMSAANVAELNTSTRRIVVTHRPAPIFSPIARP